MSLLALSLLTACDSIDDDFEGPSQQFDGLVSDEEGEDELGELDGDIDTGFWEDPADEDPGEDPEAPICSEADLLFVAEIVDGDGTEWADATTDDDLYFVGRTVNPCDGRVVLTTESRCLVQRWEIKDTSANTIAMKPDCEEGTWDWDLAPGDEVTQTSPSRRLGAGDYTLTVRFNAEPYVARKSFTIE